MASLIKFLKCAFGRIFVKNPVRITVALDEDSLRVFNELREDLGLSQSEIVRRALKFYRDYRTLENYSKDRIETYVEMLEGGEHVILDIDHWVSMLRFVDEHPKSEEFWELHRAVARAHAEEFEGKDVDYILRRLEACNFFRLSKKGGEYTLVLNNELVKKFVRLFLEELFAKMGIDYELREDLMKLRLRVG